MKNNLTKKQVHVVPTLELAMRFNRLLHTAETMPAHVLTMADAREVLWIEDELRRRLVVAIGHDFYPPDKARPTIAELKASIKAGVKASIKAVAKRIPKPVAAPKPKPAPKVVQPAVQTEGKLGFKVTIINSIGCTVKTLNLHVDGKGDAEAAARETIKQLRLKKATFKIG